MVEATALALATRIASILQIDEITFLTDNRILADLFSGGESPPNWRIKAFTQTFVNESKNRVVHVHKIDRRLNVTAHSLANQAYKLVESARESFELIVDSCRLIQGLQDVSLEHFFSHYN